MSGIEQAANDLFFKLRNRFPRINMGDENGTTTSNPTDARFFNFDYEEDEVKFGSITASLIDGQNLKLYFSKDVTNYMELPEKRKWFKFLQEIRKFAKAHMLGLDVRDIAKDVLSHKDLEFVSKQNKEKSQIGESRVLWARRGTVSEGNVGNVKVHVMHSERMDENPNNRLLRVDRIFLVNESGERFLLPFKSVMAAKAMANHVGRGGNPYDNAGRIISTAVNEMTNLRRFASATRRKTFESEDAVQVIEAAHAIKESIKRSLFRLANNTRFDENMEDLNKLLAEQDEVEDIKPYFMQTAYNENLDNWIGSAAKAFKQYKGNIMEALKESAGTVAQKLKDPQWKMVLKDDPAEDRLIASSKYTDGKALLRRILGTIADRVSMDDSEIANWASQIGQDMEHGAASNEDMQLALQLAKRYQEDLKQIRDNPDAAKELRVAAFGQKKDLYGKVKDESAEFEDYVNTIGEGGEGDMMDEITADEEGMGQMKVNEIEVAETPMDRIRERAASREVTSTPAERVAERVATRTGGTTAAERVAERVSARHPMTKVAERVAARANQGDEVVAEIEDDMEEATDPRDSRPETWRPNNTGYAWDRLSTRMTSDPKDSKARKAGKQSGLKHSIRDALGKHGPKGKLPEDADMEEGNEFSGELAKAKASHRDEFEVDGKTYPVEEGIDVNPINDSLSLIRKLAGLAPITEDDMAPAANKVTPKNLGNIVQTNIVPGSKGWDAVGNLLYTIGANLKQMGKSNMVPSGQAINNYRVALYNIIAWAENPANKVDSKTVDRISKVISNVRATSGNGIERGQGELPQGWAMNAGQELIDLRMDLYNGGYQVGGKML